MDSNRTRSNEPITFKQDVLDAVLLGDAPIRRLPIGERVEPGLGGLRQMGPSNSWVGWSHFASSSLGHLSVGGGEEHQEATHFGIFIFSIA